MPIPMRPDLERSLRRAILLSQISGIFPVKLDSIGFSVSVPLALASVCFAVALCYFTISINIPSDIRIPLIWFISKIIRLSSLANAVVSIAASIKYVGLMNDILNDLLSIDVLLSQHDCFFNNEASTHFNLGVFLILSQFLILSIHMNIIEEMFVDVACMDLLFIISHAAETQYLGVLGIFLHRFRALNECLKKLRLKEDAGREAVALSNIHLMLSESLFKISRRYSLQFLIFAAMSFTRLIVFAHGFYSMQPNIVPNAVIFRWITFYWLLISFWGITRLVKIIVDVTNQAKEFNTQLYQLMLDDKNKELSANKKLCLHIAMKREVVFTAWGFFKLDYTLVHSMIVAATAYLVILIQFGQPRSTRTVPRSSPVSVYATDPRTT